MASNALSAAARSGAVRAEIERQWQSKPIRDAYLLRHGDEIADRADGLSDCFRIYESEEACRSFKDSASAAQLQPKTIHCGDLKLVIRSVLDSVDWRYEEGVRNEYHIPQRFDPQWRESYDLRSYLVVTSSADKCVGSADEFCVTFIDGHAIAMGEREVTEKFQRVRQRIQLGLQCAQVHTYDFPDGASYGPTKDGGRWKRQSGPFYMAVVPGALPCRLPFQLDGTRVCGTEYCFYAKHARDRFCEFIAPRRTAPLDVHRVNWTSFTCTVSSADGTQAVITLPHEGSTVHEAKQLLQVALPGHEAALQELFVAGQEEPLADDDCVVERVRLTGGALFLVMKTAE